MRSARIATVAAVAMSVLLVAVGCSGSGTPSGSSTGTVDTNATVNVGLVLEPTDLDIRTTAGSALDQVLIDNVYQGLVGRTQSNAIVNVLATKHTVSSDALTYTFTLRQGVRFDNGDKLTAADVVWSLEQEKSNATYQYSSDLASVTSIASPAADTIVLTLSKPDSDLLFALSGRAGLIFDKAATNDLKTTAIGTGPYKLLSWKQGDNIHLTRNSSYWGPKVKVAGVVFKYYTSPSAAINAVISGDVDVQTAVDPTAQSAAERRERNLARVW